jgi:aminopeptidase N
MILPTKNTHTTQKTRGWKTPIGRLLLLALSSIVFCPKDLSASPSHSAATQPYEKASLAAYKPAATKHFDLIHTKLEVTVDWKTQQLHGTATLHIKPHFYPQHTLALDAGNLLIHHVSLLQETDKQSLAYTHQHNTLHITLDTSYTKEDILMVEISYSTKPYSPTVENKFKMGNQQGLYFINPTASNKYKPQQLWTQGQPNTSACWFPTLDSPNQRCTQETYITVEDKFKTLSNGLLVYSTLHDEQTRTDYWRLDIPHAPYLFMIAVGELAEIQDEWNDLPVCYYMEPAYAHQAKEIFGNTPEMLSFFSEQFDYPYPWPSYKQIVVRDYIADAMENTTAVLFSESMQGDERTLLDKIDPEEIIAHELAHHWFGNLVTCESWSQLLLNEALATWGSHQWYDYKYGPLEKQRLMAKSIDRYLQEAQHKKVALIRNQYQNPLELFDHHTYQKGCLVLHMLQNYLGSEAFLQAASEYLKRHAFSATDIHQLRKCFEEVSGQDLNWFFNQWFFASGHPILRLEHTYAKGHLYLKIWQKQTAPTPIYHLPLMLHLWLDNTKESHAITIDKPYQELHFILPKQPKAIYLDRNYLLAGEIEQPQSTNAWWHLYRHETDFFGKYQAIQYFKSLKKDSLSYYNFFSELLSDSTHWEFQLIALDAFKGYQPLEKAYPSISIIEKKLHHLLQAPHSAVRRKTIETLSEWPKAASYLSLYENSLNDSSYQVVAAALQAYTTHAPEKVLSKKEDMLLTFESYDNPAIALQLASHYTLVKKADKYTWLKEKTEKLCTQLGGETLLIVLAQYSNKVGTPEQQATILSLIEQTLASSFSIRLHEACYKALHILPPTKAVMTLLGALKQQ